MILRNPFITAVRFYSDVIFPCRGKIRKGKPVFRNRSFQCFAVCGNDIYFIFIRAADFIPFQIKIRAAIAPAVYVKAGYFAVAADFRAVWQIHEIAVHIAADTVNFALFGILPHIVIAGIIRLGREMRKPNAVIIGKTCRIQLAREERLVGIDARLIACRLDHFAESAGIGSHLAFCDRTLSPGGIQPAFGNAVKFIIKEYGQLQIIAADDFKRLLRLCSCLALVQRLRKPVYAYRQACCLRIFDIGYRLRVRIDGMALLRIACITGADHSEFNPILFHL